MLPCFRSSGVDYREHFRVHDHRLRLSAVDPNFHGHHSNAQSAEPETERYRQKLTHLQTVLYAAHKRSVLILLQALDAGGKDGTIRHAFTALNPQGVSVTAFKGPTQIELDHDFLWRVHPHTPGKGEIAIFNRSHYEDVLVTRVHKQIDERTLTDRYKLICAFERMLVDSGYGSAEVFPAHQPTGTARPFRSATQ